MARKDRKPRADRKPRKPREARAPRQIAGKGAVVFSFLRNSNGNLAGATQHQLKRVSDGSSEIDPSRSDRNRTLVGSGNITADVREYEKNIEIRGHARDSSQPYLTLVLSASPEFFRPAGGPPGSEVDTPEDADRLDAWISASTDWLTDTFGPDLVSVIYNGDETTPHLHIAVVPTYMRSEKIKPRRLVDEDPEDHAKRVADWQERGARKRTRSWASNSVVGRLNSSDLLRREYADAMAPMGLHYALASYVKSEPDDPVSAREFRDVQKAEAAKAREEAEAKAKAAAEQLRLAEAARADADAMRQRFVDDTARVIAKSKAALAAERKALADERAAIEKERDALRADVAVVEAVVTGLETGGLTHSSTLPWVQQNSETLRRGSRMFSRLLPFVRSILNVQRRTDEERSSVGVLYKLVRTWLSRPDLNDDARSEAEALRLKIDAASSPQA